MVDTIELLERRYGIVADVTLDRLRIRLARNRQRQRHLDSQIDELTTERRRLADEDGRIEVALAAAIDDAALRIRIEHHEGWSPQPIVGYRLWEIADDEIRGATGHPWPAPHMDATCGRARLHDDLPHTDFTCSEVGYGCGIYAASSVGGLGSPRASGWAVGIVLLSGKVVEHDRGYRAAHARVAAAIAHLDGRQLATADIDLLEELYATPSATVATRGQLFPSWDRAAHITILEDLGRSIELWT